MNDSKQLGEALSLALQLAPRERLRLVEQVVASVERDLAAEALPDDGLPWGERVNRLLDTLDLSEWEAMSMSDAVEWVKTIRHQDVSRHNPLWDEQA
jgi:hypothetical protein